MLVWIEITEQGLMKPNLCPENKEKRLILYDYFTSLDTLATSYINITKEKPGASAELKVQRKHLSIQQY